MVEDYLENYGNGWISLYRSIKHHWIWSDPVKLKWWLSILFEVNHSDSKTAIGYTLVECKRGQSLKSLRTWASEFECGTKAATRFFDLLEKDGMITRETIGKGKHSTTLLTVCNYDTYQNKKEIEETLDTTQGRHKGDTRETQGKRKGHTNNNDNNDNNGNNIPPYPPLDSINDLEDSIEGQNSLPKTEREKPSSNKPPSEIEVIKYFSENGYTEVGAKKAFEYYNEPMLERNGRVWKDSKGNTVKNWKQKMRGVWFKDEYKKDLTTGMPDEMAERLRKACKWATETLNKSLGTNYSPEEKNTVEPILNRLKEGYGFKEFKIVIDKKTREWKGTDMQKNLHPNTLFGKKFSMYLEQQDPNDSSETPKSVTLKIGEHNR